MANRARIKLAVLTASTDKITNRLLRNKTIINVAYKPSFVGFERVCTWHSGS